MRQLPDGFPFLTTAVNYAGDIVTIYVSQLQDLPSANGAHATLHQLMQDAFGRSAFRSSCVFAWGEMGGIPAIVARPCSHLGGR